MKTVLVAGGTGNLGAHLIQALKSRGYYVKALVRNPGKLRQTKGKSGERIYPLIDEVIEGDLTKPRTLRGCCHHIDYVVSAAGLTGKAQGQTFQDVDYQGNVYLLREAEKSGVKKMMYIHVFMDESWKQPGSLIEAKENFVKQLKDSEVPHIIIKPTGYFSDMAQIFQMAKSGRVYLLGNGEAKMNPIHEQDVAQFSAGALQTENKIFDIGGPEVYTYQEMAKLAFTIQGRKERITYIPAAVLKCISFLLKWTSKHTYGLFQFLFNVMTHDLVAPKYGSYTLETFFKEASS